jgi:hypothetical protein
MGASPLFSVFLGPSSPGLWRCSTHQNRDICFSLDDVFRALRDRRRIVSEDQEPGVIQEAGCLDETRRDQI